MHRRLAPSPRSAWRGLLVVALALILGTLTIVALGLLAQRLLPGPADGPVVAAPATPTRSPGQPAARPTPSPRPSTPLSAPLQWVSDGDTIVVLVDAAPTKVRLIGVDAPEVGGPECYAPQATARLKEILGAGPVTLVPDLSQRDRDKYGRLLRHVLTPDGRLAGALLVQGGYAVELTVGRPHAQQEAYRRDEAAARAAGRGLWSACQTSLSAQTGAKGQ